MDTPQKIAIGCGIGCAGLLLIGACGGIGLYFWADAKRAEIVSSFDAMDGAGESYGEAHDAEECVVEALRREKGQLDDTMFLYGCLEVAKQPDGFCDDVPALASTMKEAETVDTWRKERCAALGHPDVRCEQLVVQQQSACERSRSVSPDGGTR